MKKIIFLLASAFVLCVFNVFATNNDEQTSLQGETVCNFSLNHYTGKFLAFSDGRVVTSNIKVRQTCTAETTQRATVYVYVDKVLVASDVFEIKAGRLESTGERHIRVSKEYKDKSYTLKVI
ncbi:MAG: hypothetical protein J6R16_02495 [Alistipes sp.]|nr:hypothetical protein [Alistipes sp.]